MSTLVDLLVLKVGTRVTKILAEAWLGKEGSTVLGDALDGLFGRFQSTADQRKAKREFEALGEKIAEDLLPLFESASRRGHLNAEAVVFELEATLAKGNTAAFILGSNLDPEVVLSKLRALRPLPRHHYSEAEEQLYERTLERAVRRLIEVSARLPQFIETFAAKSLQELQKVSGNVEEILGIVRRTEITVGFRTSESRAQEYEVSYRLAIQRNLDYLELFGIDLRPESRRQKLSVGYVSLTLQSRVGQGPESLPAEALFDRLSPKRKYLLIRGEAGSGKSTLLRWAAMRAAEGSLSDYSWSDPSTRETLYLQADATLSNEGEAFDAEIMQPSPELVINSFPTWRRLVPLFIPLRQCKLGRLPSPEDFPELIAGALGKPPADWINSVLRMGRALILLDGVDEIPNAHREITRHQIADLIGEYPDNFVVVSSRPQAVEPEWLESLGFYEARINPMSELDRSSFIDRWHQAVINELTALGKPTDDLPGIAISLKQQLASIPPVARLATNPLLCAMICALHRDRHQKLPERQRDLCEALCEALVHRRERESGLDLSQFPEAYQKLDYPQKRAALQELAHYMVLNGYSSVPYEDAEGKIGLVLRFFPGHSASNARIVAESLVERSGILREETTGSIGFVHNAFKELLAGDYFADQNDAGLLALRALDYDWQPTVLFAVGTSRRDFATRVIRELLDNSSLATSRQRQVMALRCRAAALFVDEKLDQRLQQLASSLFPPRSIEDAQALAEFGDPAVRLLHAKESLPEEVTIASIRTLRLIGTPLAKEALHGYLADRRLSVIDELSQAVNPLEIVQVQDWLTAGKRLPEGIASQVADTSPIAALSDLRLLHLSGTAITEISHLSYLANLQHLHLSETQVADVSPLASLSSLETLYLTGTKVIDAAPLGFLINLQILSLARTQVNNISDLSCLLNLQQLYLTETQISNISPLSRLVKLNSLSLSGTQVNDLAPLASLTNLVILYLAGTEVTDASPLASLCNLRSLDLSKTQVSDVSKLASLYNLRRLDLRGSQVTDISPLSSLRNCHILWR